MQKMIDKKSVNTSPVVKYYNKFEQLTIIISISHYILYISVITFYKKDY